MTELLARYVAIRGRFHRSVHVASDWTSRDLLKDYLVTPTVRELSGQILGELARPGGTRAWSITGPYGAGKSAFALFLADALAGSSSVHPAAKELRVSCKFTQRPFTPVLVTAERGPLGPPLATAIARSAGRQSSRMAARFIREAGDTSGSGSALAALLTRTADALTARGAGGLLLVIDELGKFLEYAAAGHGGDVFLLQQLAEAAARSASPIALVTILHTAFADYLPVHDELRRTEWQKVQGRFRDVPFQLPAEQVLALISLAIRRTAPAEVEAAWRAEVAKVVDSPALVAARSRLPLGELAERCVPLHPVTALLLWPIFRSKGAQNERSLFSFLTSHEPFGFQEFLRTTRTDRGVAPLYSVAQLYDYLTSALGFGAFRGEQARKWALIDTALSRLPADAPAICGALIKAAGLISIYGASVGLVASRELLALACGSSADVEPGCDFLERASILVPRRHLGGYVLWEGSDVDLEAAFVDATHRVAGRSLAARLGETLGARAVVAKAHYVERGTLRYFDVDYVDVGPGTVAHALAQPTEADGRLLFALRSPGDELRTVRAIVLEESQREPQALGVVGIPRDTVRLEAALRDTEAWAWVASHTVELQSDPVARQEVRARLTEARERLERAAGPVFGLPGHRLDPAACIWVHCGKEVAISDGNAFQKWVSRLCDATFSKAPRLRNELLNRRALSSAASAARRVLLERLLTQADQPRLGMEGMPPEVSMYESMLRRGGFHRKVGDKWRLAAPSGDWRPVWEALLEFVQQARHGRRPVTELYARLQSAPFGLRDGPIPILLATALQLYRETIALYEAGVFVPSLRIEVLERLMRRPEDFEIQSHRLSQVQRATLRALEEIVAGRDAAGDHRGRASLLSVAKALVLFVAHLPPFAKQTRRLASDIAAARDRILEASDPAKLVFEDLPTSLGVSLQGREGVRLFAARVEDCLRTLGRVYPQLLDDIEGQIRTAFGLPAGLEAAQRGLQARALAVLPAVADGRLQVFVREASRDTRARDWREVLARVANGGIPPSHWKDADVTTFQLRLAELASDFERLEELVAEQRRSGASRVLRFGLLDGSSAELRAVLPLRDEFEPLVDELVQRVTDALEGTESSDGAGQRLQLEVLGRVAAAILAQGAAVQAGSVQ